jgi:integration host factor subunit alpha
MAFDTLTKAELVEALHQQTGCHRHDGKIMVDTFFEEIVNTLVQGETVKLSGFGHFTLRDKSERPGRNPRTGVDVPIQARRVVTFHASQKLKAHVANIPCDVA